MLERIGKDSALAREAMRVAQRAAAERVLPAQPEQGRAEPARFPALDAHPVAGVGAAQGPDFASALESGIQAVDQRVQAAESMPVDLLTGKIDDFHEIAVQLKSAELSFKFAMEIRNKLVDAYREIMRMNV
jgi:flagellar hook-basal body complex protein FliE